jgi:hypothetical protein
MLNRVQVIQLIDAERQYQDLSYNPDEKLSSGLTRRQRDLDVTSGLVMLDTYLRKAQDDWTNQKCSSRDSLRQVAKLAAIAVRILERAGGSEVLVTQGLR